MGGEPVRGLKRERVGKSLWGRWFGARGRVSEIYLST